MRISEWYCDGIMRSEQDVLQKNQKASKRVKASERASEREKSLLSPSMPMPIVTCANQRKIK